jgi:hypothetical protein
VCVQETSWYKEAIACGGLQSERNKHRHESISSPKNIKQTKSRWARHVEYKTAMKNKYEITAQESEGVIPADVFAPGGRWGWKY